MATEVGEGSNLVSLACGGGEEQSPLGDLLDGFPLVADQPVIGVSEVEFEAGESYEEASINWLAKNGIGPVKYSGRDNIRVAVGILGPTSYPFVSTLAVQMQ